VTLLNDPRPSARIERAYGLVDVRPLSVHGGILVLEVITMKTTTMARDARIFLRCKAAQKTLIERAAESLGMTTSDYVLSAALARSIEDVQRRNRLVLSDAGFSQLLEFMEADPEPEAQLVENACRYRRAIGSGTLIVED